LSYINYETTNLKIYSYSRHNLPDYYIIDYGSCINESEIATRLGITLNIYINILKHNNAFLHKLGHIWYQYVYAFNNLKDINNTIEELEPYLILEKLTE